MKLKAMIWVHKIFFIAGCAAMFFHGATHAYAVRMAEANGESSILCRLPLNALAEVSVGKDI